VEGDTSCELDLVEVDPAGFEASHGFDPSELIALAEGTRVTSLRWTAITNPGATTRDTDPLEVELRYAGAMRFYPRCEHFAELDMSVSLRSGGTLQLETAATLTSTRRDQARIHATVPLVALPQLTEAAAAITSAATSFELDMEIAGGQLYGDFSMRGRLARCPLASWPSARACVTHETPVDAKALHHGLKGDYLVEAWQDMPKTQRVSWLDGSETELGFEFVPTGDEACTLGPYRQDGDGGNLRMTYSLPGEVHVATTDGKVNIRFPGRLSTSGYDGDWSELQLTSDGRDIAPPSGLGTLDFDALQPPRRAVVYFNSPSRWDNPAIILGGLELEALDAHAELVAPEGGLCTAQDFLGTTRQVDNTTYLAPEPP
jgi:hypothetical protein